MLAILQQRITELLEEKLEGTDCFVVDIKISATQKIQVALDADSGLTIDTCSKISRFLEKRLEAEGLVGEKYLLEVSSPGLDQPLKQFRQYQKNIGREIDVLLHNGSQLEGTLLEADENALLINKVVNKKPVKKKETSIAFRDINRTKVKITF